MEENSGRFLELVTSARQSLSVGDHATAGDFANLLLKEFPKSEEGWLVLASISEPEDALGHLEKALRINPGSQAARQAIRLITRQVLDGNQIVIEIPEILPLDDTQPIKINEINADDFDLAVELDVTNTPDSGTGFQETSNLGNDQVHSDEIIVEIEPVQENQDDASLVEEFPEFQPDSSENLENSNEIKPENQEFTSSSDAQIVGKKVHIRKKKAKAIEQPQNEPIAEPLKVVKSDQKFQQKKFNVEIVELFLIAGFAVLLPVLVFLYFYFTR
jgi:hypothetical protein